jgi:hypothetical protein
MSSERPSHPPLTPASAVPAGYCRIIGDVGEEGVVTLRQPRRARPSLRVVGGRDQDPRRP